MSINNEPDWANWENHLFSPKKSGDDDIGAEDPMRMTEYDLKTVEDVLNKARDIGKRVFGEEASVGTALDIYDRLMAYKINRVQLDSAE